MPSPSTDQLINLVTFPFPEIEQIPFEPLSGLFEYKEI